MASAFHLRSEGASVSNVARFRSNGLFGTDMHRQGVLVNSNFRRIPYDSR